MESEKHIFMLWEKAREQENRIIKNIQEKFNVLKAYKISWNKTEFNKNLSRFYGENLPNGCHKHLHVGDGEMSLYIVEDKKPIYNIRETSKGLEKVNINIFDKKQLYRKWTGGGHKIHASNNIKEAKSDILLLTGELYDEINNELWNQEYRNIYELTGNESWKSIQDVFEILNNRIDYVVLRNFECLPNNYYCEKHGDIDLLVRNIDQTVTLLNAVKVYKERYRVHYTVNINNEKVYFDFRYVGDNYYCKDWQINIINNSVYYNNIKIPNKLNHKYSLLYHALIHKPEITDDYKDKLNNLFLTKQNKFEFYKELQIYLNQKNYQITDPIDLSVYLNYKYFKQINLRRALYYSHITNGQFIKWDKTLNNKFRNSELNNEKIINILGLANKKILFQNMGIGISLFTELLYKNNITVYEKDLITCDCLHYIKDIKHLYYKDVILNTKIISKYDLTLINVSSEDELFKLIVNIDISTNPKDIYIMINRNIINHIEYKTKFKFNILYLCDFNDFGFNTLIDKNDELSHSKLGNNCPYYIINLSNREVKKNKNSVWFSCNERNIKFRTESTKINGRIIKRGEKIDNDKLLFEPNYINDYYSDEDLETKLCKNKNTEHFLLKFNDYYSKINYISKIKIHSNQTVYNDYLIDGKLIDAIPKNIIQNGNDYIYFDTEWKLKIPIPLSYLKYRALLSLMYNSKLTKKIRLEKIEKLFTLASGIVKFDSIMQKYNDNEVAFQNFVKTADHTEIKKINFQYERINNSSNSMLQQN